MICFFIFIVSSLVPKLREFVLCFSINKVLVTIIAKRSIYIGPKCKVLLSIGNKQLVVKRFRSLALFSSLPNTLLATVFFSKTKYCPAHKNLITHLLKVFGKRISPIKWKTFWKSLKIFKCISAECTIYIDNCNCLYISSWPMK